MSDCPYCTEDEANMTIYEKLHHRWYDRAKNRARRDARYSEIENEITTDQGTLRWTGNEDLWKEWDAIFDRINKRPLYLRAARFIEHKHLTPRWLRSRARVFWQRGKQGWSYRDVWSIDHYLNDVIIGMVTQLRANNHGHPAGILDGDPMSSHPGEQAYWAAVLTGIIEGFEAAKTLVNDYPKDEELKRVQDAFDLGFELFHAYYFDLWD